jgi:anti-anti-sigma factor
MTGKIAWHGKVSIENAGKLKDEITQAFAQNDSLALDLSRVETIDTSGIQLLVAMIKEAQNKNIALVFEGQVPKEVNRRLLMGGFVKQAVTDGNQLIQILNQLSAS